MRRTSRRSRLLPNHPRRSDCCPVGVPRTPSDDSSRVLLPGAAVKTLPNDSASRCISDSPIHAAKWNYGAPASRSSPSFPRAVGVICASRNYSVAEKARDSLSECVKTRQETVNCDRSNNTVPVGVRFPLYVLGGCRAVRKPSPSFRPMRAYFVSPALLRETTKAFCSTSVYLPPSRQVYYNVLYIRVTA